MINLFIADDHQLVIDGIKLMLSDEEDIVCKGEANDGAAALEGLKQANYDIILLDINMPKINGVDACRQIRRDYPNIRILILSMLKEASMIKMMLKNGANGYLLKNAGKADILKAIRTVVKGQQYFSPEVADIVMASLAGAEKKEQKSPFPQLSRREKQVLQLIVNEYTTGEIASELGISFGTVETHRRNLLIKLGARNTAGLVRTGLEYGLLE